MICDLSIEFIFRLSRAGRKLYLTTLPGLLREHVQPMIDQGWLKTHSLSERGEGCKQTGYSITDAGRAFVERTITGARGELSTNRL